MNRQWKGAVVALVLVVGLAGCGSEKVVTVTAGSTTGTIDDAPATDTTTQTTTTDGTQSGAKDIELGGTGTDGALSIRARAIASTRSPVAAQEYADPIVPATGAKLVVVDLTVRNDGSNPLTPFCGGGGTVLIDERNRNFNPDSRQFQAAGNDDLCQDLNPGFRRDLKLVFQVPLDAKISAVAVWDSDEPGDYSGDTWLRFPR